MALLSTERVASGRGVIDADGYQVTKPSGAVAGGIADTLAAASTQAAPGATTVQAAISTPPVGVYDVTVTISLTGTAETALTNLQLRQNAVVVATLPTISAQTITMRFPRVTVAGGNIDIRTSAAATAGSVYTTTITATRVS